MSFEWYLVIMKYIVHQAFLFKTPLQSVNLFFDGTQYTSCRSSWRKKIWMCCCRYKLTCYCNEQITLLRDRSISPLSNQFIEQPKFSLTFAANQELIRMSIFRADISPDHIVYIRLKEDHAIFSVSYCIAYLDSFRYDSPRCSVPTKPVLCRVTYFDKFNPRYSTIQLLEDQQYVCVTVYSQWTTASDYKNVNCKRQMSHQWSTDYFASIFFQTNSTDRELHRHPNFE